MGAYLFVVGPVVGACGKQKGRSVRSLHASVCVCACVRACVVTYARRMDVCCKDLSWSGE